MQIKAAVAREAGQPLSIENINIEEPRDNEILVKMVATGICHTDLSVMAGYLPTPLPAVLGHEGAGIVEKVGSSISKVKPGDPVVITFNVCGGCPSCQQNDRAYCYEFFPRNFLANRPDGSSSLSAEGDAINSNFFGQSSFATHAICHENNVVKVPTDVPLEMLGPLACGIQTGAGSVMNSMKVYEGSSFVVFGAGSVGLSAIMAAKVQKAAINIAVDIKEDRLEMAKELGATHVINSSKEDALAKIKEITGGGVNFSLDTTGIPDVIRVATDCLGIKGICGVLGANPPGTEMTLNAFDFLSHGRRLMGLIEGDAISDEFIPKLIDLYKAGEFPFDKLISYYEFDQINEAINDTHTGKAIKPIVKF